MIARCPIFAVAALLVFRWIPACGGAPAKPASAAPAVPDPRHLSNGWSIPSEGYADQPYIVKAEDGAWLCAMTTGAGAEGAGGQHVVSMRSTDQGRTWEQIVPIEPADGPEASYAVLLKVPSGRVYAFYNHNTDKVREVKREDKGARRSSPSSWTGCCATAAISASSAGAASARRSARPTVPTRCGSPSLFKPCGSTTARRGPARPWGISRWYPPDTWCRPLPSFPPCLLPSSAPRPLPIREIRGQVSPLPTPDP